MKPRLRKLILKLLKRQNLMSLATNRPDGYPQATTVTYANDGLDLYFACDQASQKVRNLQYSPKVSLTIDGDSEDWNRIQGLSMAANARVVGSAAEQRRALRLLQRKFPEMKDMSDDDLSGLAVVKVQPKVISVIDYTRGFGHTDLARV